MSVQAGYHLAMIPTSFRDLAAFGLKLVPAENSEASAVLLNESGKAVVALAHVWEYQTSRGQGSSLQMEVLNGRSTVVPDRFNFILPGSKRVINEQGMFGDNSDVLGGDADQIVESIRSGDSIGRAFEILRPFAKRRWRATMALFANGAIHQLIQGEQPELLLWFEHLAQPVRPLKVLP